MDKPLLVHVLFNPVRYIGCSFALLVGVRYLYPESFVGMKADRTDLASLCMWNFMLATGLVLYHTLSLIFFGRISRDVASVVLEKVFSYITLKLVLVEIILQTGITSTTRWVLWFIVIGICKGLTAHGIIHVEGLSSASRSWHHFIRPFGHLLCVTGGVLFLFQLARAASIDLADLDVDIYLLLFYDIIFQLLDLVHTSIIFIVNLLNTLEILPSSVCPNEWAYVVDSIVNLAQLCLTLAHLFHIGVVNGISLSLVDMVIILNSRSFLIQIVRKVTEMQNYLRIKQHLKAHFKTVVGPKYINVVNTSDIECCEDLDSEVCPICIQGFPMQGKKLPCGHLLHTDCLRTLIQKQSEVYLGPPFTEDLTNSFTGMYTAVMTNEPSIRNDDIRPASSPEAIRSRDVDIGNRGNLLQSLRRRFTRVFDRARRSRSADTVVEHSQQSSHALHTQSSSARSTSVQSHNSISQSPATENDTLHHTHSHKTDNSLPPLIYPLRFIKCPICRKNVDVASGRLLPKFDPKAATPPTPTEVGTLDFLATHS